MQIFCISYELRDFLVDSMRQINHHRSKTFLVWFHKRLKCSTEQSPPSYTSLVAITLGSQLGSSACFPLSSSTFHPAQQIPLLSPFLAEPVIGEGAIKQPKV